MTADTQAQGDLAPCPFCGEYDGEVAQSHIPKIHGGHKIAVYCNGCFAEGPPCDTESEAVDAWNSRAALQGRAQEGEPSETEMQTKVADIFDAIDGFEEYLSIGDHRRARADKIKAKVLILALACRAALAQGDAARAGGEGEDAALLAGDAAIHAHFSGKGGHE